MKKQFYFIMLFFTITLSIQSQILVNNSVDLTGGYTPDGFAGNANFNIIFEESYAKLGIYFSASENKTSNGYDIPYNIFAINGGYFIPVYKSNNERMGLSAGAGVSVGYEVVNKGNKELENGAIIQSNSNFIYGGFVGADLEYGLTPNFYILTNVKEYYHLNSDLGAATLYAGLGIKFYIN